MKPNNKNNGKIFNVNTEKNNNNTIFDQYNKYLNDEEKNNLEYKKAVVLDKRTYFQYYFSLLKKKQLILFTFLPSNDYNLIFVKIALFIVSFSLYFTINGFLQCMIFIRIMVFLIFYIKSLKYYIHLLFLQ